MSRASRVLLLPLLIAAGSPLVGGPALAKAKAKARAKVTMEREPASPPSVLLESIDLGAGKAVVRVGGASQAPEARHFVFHDQRERHFVALLAACDELVASALHEAESGQPIATFDPVFRCTLDLPRPYLKARLLGLTVRLRGRDVAADEHDVEALLSAARSAATGVAHIPLAVPMTSVSPSSAAASGAAPPAAPAPSAAGAGSAAASSPGAREPGRTRVEDDELPELDGEPDAD